MSELILFLGIGLALLVLLLLWARQGMHTAASRESVSAIRDALTALHLEIPPRALATRIFALQDYQFVSNQAPQRIQRLFREERKRLALLWLRQTRQKVGEVMALYRRAVRRNLSLRPAVEVRLAINYGLFFLCCELLRGLIWLYGPFVVRGLVDYTAGLAEQLSLWAAELAVRLDQAGFGRIERAWPQGRV